MTTTDMDCMSLATSQLITDIVTHSLSRSVALWHPCPTFHVRLEPGVQCARVRQQTFRSLAASDIV